MSVTIDPATYEGINMTAFFLPLYLGATVCMILSGITLLQAYNYFPSQDRLAIRLLAGAMLFLDIVSTGLISQGLYYYLIPHFGSLLPLQSLVQTLSAECVLSSFIVLISQAYFAWQIYIVANKDSVTAKIFVPGLVMLFALVSFTGGIGCSVIMFTHSHNILMNRNYTFVVFAGIVKGASVIADILATVALCYELGTSRTGIKQTDSLLKTLMQYIIERGVLVTLTQTVFLIIFFTTAKHAYWLGLHVNVTKLYANTFFAMLNGRQALKEKRPSTAYLSASGSGDAYSSSNFSYPVPHTSGVKFPTSSDSGDVHEMKTGGVNVDKTVIIADI